MIKYEVWRYHQLKGTFSFKQLREWMLTNFPSEYHEDIRNAKFGETKNYNIRALNWIAVNSEYCAIHKIGGKQKCE